MPYGSGLSAQLMTAPETVVGTGLTPTNSYEFLNETVTWQPTWVDGMGLKAGQTFKRASRTIQSRFSVGGDIVLEHADRGHMGALWKQALGSAITVPTIIGATTAYKQIHVPGNRTGMSHTVQVGRPQTDGTVRPFTWRGTKFVSWEFSCNDNQLAQLKVTVDAWQESTATALAAASYVGAAQVFNFSQASVFTLGGTASTTAGETTVATGVQVATIIRGITLTNANPMAVDRYGLGNAGVKKEQIENAIPTVTGHLDGEFTQRTEIYDLMQSNTTVPLELDFVSTSLAGAGNPFLLAFILPAVKFKAASPQAAGPDIVKMGVDFEAYDDGSGTNPVIQVKLVSTDTTL
jgi:hypothetical protein